MTRQDLSEAESLITAFAPTFLLHFEPKFTNFVLDGDSLRVDISCNCESPSLFLIDRGVIGQTPNHNLLSSIKSLPVDIYCGNCSDLSSPDDSPDDGFLYGQVMEFRHACPQYHCGNTTFNISLVLFVTESHTDEALATSSEEEIISFLLNIPTPFDWMWLDGECHYCKTHNTIVDYDVINRCLV